MYNRAALVIGVNFYWLIRLRPWPKNYRNSNLLAGFERLFRRIYELYARFQPYRSIRFHLKLIFLLHSKNLQHHREARFQFWQLPFQWPIRKYLKKELSQILLSMAIFPFGRLETFLVGDS